MALDHAILVSLLEKPGSGYELARRFERSIGYFWTATHQQIYRVLKRMESDGWIDVREVPQQARPDKKEYSVAAPGRAALAGVAARADRTGERPARTRGEDPRGRLRRPGRTDP